MVTDILSISIILFESVCCRIFFDIFLERKTDNTIKQLFSMFIVVFLATVSFITSVFVSDAMLKSMLIISLYFFTQLIFYQFKFKTMLILSLTLYLMLLAFDYLAMQILMMVFAVNLDAVLESIVYFPFATIISKVLLFLAIITIKRFLAYYKGDEDLSTRDWLITLFYSIISLVYFLAIITLTFNMSDIPIIVIIATIGLLFSIFLNFELLQSVNLYVRSERTNVLLKKQLEVELSNAMLMKSSYDSQRKLMHDYKNHFTTIYNLLKTSNYHKALFYVKDLSEATYISIYRIKTNHDIIDAVLNQKDQICQQKGITLNIHSGDLSQLKVPTEYLVTIIANVMDNAIEASEKLEGDKVIYVKLIIEDNTLIFSVINPTGSKVIIKNNTISTTKTDKSIHGLGLQNVAQAILSCGGDFDLDSNNKQFRFTALIPLKSNNR